MPTQPGAHYDSTDFIEFSGHKSQSLWPILQPDHMRSGHWLVTQSFVRWGVNIAWRATNDMLRHAAVIIKKCTGDFSWTQNSKFTRRRMLKLTYLVSVCILLQLHQFQFHFLLYEGRARLENTHLFEWRIGTVKISNMGGGERETANTNGKRGRCMFATNLCSPWLPVRVLEKK